MTTARMEAALARIERAAQRIDRAGEAIDSCEAAELAGVRARHERLRTRVAEVVARLDALIGAAAG